MNKQQTAIEFFDEQIRELEIEYEITLISKKDYWLKRNVIVEQAKEMEKQQIIEAYEEGCFDSILDEKTDKARAEDYYNKTFKK